MDTSLLILAAGIGSRYGGMKQMDSFGPSGETITDYSIFDAIRAGFNRVVFVISPQMEEEFRTSYCKKFPADLEVDYVIQSLHNIPDGYTFPSERVKPWGTAHAVLMAEGSIREPFAVINADDFYGRDSYRIMHEFLVGNREGKEGAYCMVGYELQKTISEHGSVARGVCSVDESGLLAGMVERTRIFLQDGRIVYQEEDGITRELDRKAIVSMNLFGFTPDFFTHAGGIFRTFLEEHVQNPKAEFYIPYVVDKLIHAGMARMSVLPTPDAWFGVTYQDDKPWVMQSIQNLVKEGVYPESLWG